MRVTTFVLLVSLALATISDVDGATHRKIDCSKYKTLPHEEKFCPQVYIPICASDGKTYGNDCYFCREVAKT